MFFMNLSNVNSSMFMNLKTNVFFILFEVPMKEGNKVNLVRIRNPWGNDVEWNGSWNDK